MTNFYKNTHARNPKQAFFLCSCLFLLLFIFRLFYIKNFFLKIFMAIFGKILMREKLNKLNVFAFLLILFIFCYLAEESLWRNGWTAALKKTSSVAQLRSLSHYYSWEKYEPPISLAMWEEIIKKKKKCKNVTVPRSPWKEIVCTKKKFYLTLAVPLRL